MLLWLRCVMCVWMTTPTSYPRTTTLIYEDYGLPYKNWIAIYFQVPPSETTLLKHVQWCGLIQDGPLLSSCDGAPQQRQLYPSNQVLVHQQIEQPNVLYINPVVLGGWLNPLHQQWLIVSDADIVYIPDSPPTGSIRQFTHFGMPHELTSSEVIATTTSTTTWSEAVFTTTTSTEMITTEVVTTTTEPAWTPPQHSWIGFVVIVSVGFSSLALVLLALKFKWIRIPQDDISVSATHVGDVELTELERE